MHNLQAALASLAIGRQASPQCRGVTAGKTRRNTRNVRGVTEGKMGHNSSVLNHQMICFNIIGHGTGMLIKVLANYETQLNDDD